MAPAANAAAATQIQVGRCFISTPSSRVDGTVDHGHRHGGKRAGRGSADDGAGVRVEGAAVARASDLAVADLETRQPWCVHTAEKQCTLSPVSRVTTNFCRAG